MQIYLRNRVNFWNIAIGLSCLQWLALSTTAIADFPTVYLIAYLMHPSQVPLNATPNNEPGKL